MNRINLKTLSRLELDDWILSVCEKKFRATQLWSWMYQKNETNFERMTDLAKDFRKKLLEIAEVGTLELEKVQASEISGTRKYLWRLGDGMKVESVFIPDGHRRTVCVSSQVGCAMNCRFCATGSMGFLRNLSEFEILEQFLGVWRTLPEKPTNIVIMGMGEPFLNYENVIKAMTILKHPDGAAIGARKITISTSGIVPQILRFSTEKQPFQLAISLNASSDQQRSQIMPINKKYPVDQLLNAAKQYAKSSRRRLTFEYVLLGGFNDTAEDAARLRKLLHGLPCKINLIAFNPTSDGLIRPADEHVHEFAEWIRPICAPVTLRLSKGDDIDGACGQLAVKNLKTGIS